MRFCGDLDGDIDSVFTDGVSGELEVAEDW